MTRVVVCIVVAMFWFVARGVAPLPIPAPAPPTPVVNPSGPLAPFVRQMTKDERSGLSDAYATLARAVAANPADEPVFVSTGAVRAAHRAALLCVWRGALGNEAGKYPGLREALEGVLADRIGTDDLPLNPAIQKSAAEAFAEISASLR